MFVQRKGILILTNINIRYVVILFSFIRIGKYTSVKCVCIMEGVFAIMDTGWDQWKRVIIILATIAIFIIMAIECLIGLQGVH